MADNFIFLRDVTVEMSSSIWCHQQIASPTPITNIVVANNLRGSKKVAFILKIFKGSNGRLHFSVLVSIQMDWLKQWIWMIFWEWRNAWPMVLLVKIDFPKIQWFLREVSRQCLSIHTSSSPSVALERHGRTRPGLGLGLGLTPASRPCPAVDFATQRLLESRHWPSKPWNQVN